MPMPKEIRRELAAFPGPGGTTVKAVCIWTPVGGAKIDIRQYFTSEDEQLIPTKKGLRLSRKAAGRVEECLKDFLALPDPEETL